MGGSTVAIEQRLTSHMRTGVHTSTPLSVLFIHHCCALYYAHRSDGHAPANFHWSPQHKQQQQQQCHHWGPDAPTITLPLS